jgi:hypothetical protein
VPFEGNPSLDKPWLYNSEENLLTSHPSALPKDPRQKKRFPDLTLYYHPGHGFGANFAGDHFGWMKSLLLLHDRTQETDLSLLFL